MYIIIPSNKIKIVLPLFDNFCCSPCKEQLMTSYTLERTKKSIMKSYTSNITTNAKIFTQFKRMLCIRGKFQHEEYYNILQIIYSKNGII